MEYFLIFLFLCGDLLYIHFCILLVLASPFCRGGILGGGGWGAPAACSQPPRLSLDSVLAVLMPAPPVTP